MGASIWGKIKAVVYSISVIIAFISYTFNLDFLSHIIFVFFILSAIAAFFSLADYLIKFTRTDVFKSILQE